MICKSCSGKLTFLLRGGNANYCRCNTGLTTFGKDSSIACNRIFDEGGFHIPAGTILGYFNVLGYHPNLHLKPDTFKVEPHPLNIWES